MLNVDDVGDEILLVILLCVSNTLKYRFFCFSLIVEDSKEELRPLPNFKKTKLCRKFLKGVCTDENCTRAHGESELRILDQFYKKKVCKYWQQQGSCIRGLECYFGNL